MRYVAVFVGCLAAACFAQELQPESPIQERIRKIEGARTPAEFATEVAALNESISDKGEIVKQLAIFAAAPDEHSTMASFVILQKLDLPPLVVIRVLAPHLDAEDERLRSFARDWFRQHDNGGIDESPLKPVNFEDYARYVQGDQDPPTAFVEYVYERSPYRALLVFAKASRRERAIAALEADAKEFEAQKQERENPGTVQPRRRAAQRRPPENAETLLASHEVEMAVWLKRNRFDEQFEAALPQARVQLTKLSADERWWARLYAIEVMRRHRELRMGDVLEKLRSDEHALVSKAARSISN